MDLVHNNDNIDFNKFGFGVNVLGSLKSEKGLGTAVRSDVYSLRAAKIPFICNDRSDSGSLNNDNSLDCFSDNNPYLFNLIHINPHTIVNIGGSSVNYYEYLANYTAYLSGHYNIGYWVWELDNVPDYWKDVAKYLHEIWTPSDFVMQSVSKIVPVPIIKIPHCINVDNSALAASIKKRAQFKIPDDIYLFLFIFDFGSYIERKNPFGVIEAFKKAFSPYDKAMLFIKTYHTDFNRQKFYELLNSIRGYNITVSDEVLPAEGISSLMKACDCYVSLHRSEGFGLTLAEAMAFGKPVIATGYSGNMDFMNMNNSYPVNYKLTMLKENYGVYEKGNYWAEPDINHAAKLMREAFENKDEYVSTGIKGKSYIEKHFSHESIGKMYKTRLNKILMNYENKI